MSRKLPPLNALRAFEAAARNLSFKAAAVELNVTQSAVSHQVKHLENTMGINLFYRHTRSVELTSAGEKLVPYLQDAFDHIAEGTRLVSGIQGDVVLTIQTYSTFAVRWLMLRLQEFQKRYPDISVRLTASQFDVDFSKQDADLAIMIGHAEVGRIRYEYLFSPRLFPVCSPALVNSNSGLKRPSDLQNQTILQVYPSERDWQTWLSASGVQGVDPSSGQSFDSYDHALKMAVRGLGVALAMYPYVSEDFAAGLLVNPFPEFEVPADGHWYLAFPETRAYIGKIKLFKQWLIEEIHNDPDLRPLVSDHPPEPLSTSEINS